MAAARFDWPHQIPPPSLVFSSGALEGPSVCQPASGASPLPPPHPPPSSSSSLTPISHFCSSCLSSVASLLNLFRFFSPSHLFSKCLRSLSFSTWPTLRDVLLTERQQRGSGGPMERQIAGRHLRSAAVAQKLHFNRRDFLLWCCDHIFTTQRLSPRANKSILMHFPIMQLNSPFSFFFTSQ